MPVDERLYATIERTRIAVNDDAKRFRDLDEKEKEKEDTTIRKGCLIKRDLSRVTLLSFENETDRASHKYFRNPKCRNENFEIIP